MSGGKFTSIGETASGVEHHGSTPIQCRECNRSLYKRNFDVPDPVLNQCHVPGAVEIADRCRPTLSDDSVLLAEIDHPLAAELHRRRLR